MRPVSLGPLPPGAGPQETLDWVVRSLREIESASVEDPIAVANSYSTDAPPTVTRQVNVTAPSLANLAAVLATFLADLRRRGINKTT